MQIRIVTKACGGCHERFDVHCARDSEHSPSEFHVVECPWCNRPTELQLPGPEFAVWKADGSGPQLGDWFVAFLPTTVQPAQPRELRFRFWRYGEVPSDEGDAHVDYSAAAEDANGKAKEDLVNAWWVGPDDELTALGRFR